jgi:hypothetical protein
MGVFDWLRGRPRDTQEERAEARPQAPTEEAADVAGANRSAEEIDSAIDVRRDEEAVRHGGI